MTTASEQQEESLVVKMSGRLTIVSQYIYPDNVENDEPSLQTSFGYVQIRLNVDYWGQKLNDDTGDSAKTEVLSIKPILAVRGLGPN